MLSGPRNPSPGKFGVDEEGALAHLLLVDGDPITNIKLLEDPDEKPRRDYEGPEGLRERHIAVVECPLLAQSERGRRQRNWRLLFSRQQEQPNNDPKHDPVQLRKGASHGEDRESRCRRLDAVCNGAVVEHAAQI
jgi:hypothetical protein